MKLEILTPEAVYYSGEADVVTLPGTMGTFQILHNHAPIISSLTKGRLSFKVNDDTKEIVISDGIIEMHNNIITICVDSIHD